MTSAHQEEIVHFINKAREQRRWLSGELSRLDERSIDYKSNQRAICGAIGELDTAIWNVMGSAGMMSSCRTKVTSDGISAEESPAMFPPVLFQQNRLTVVWQIGCPLPSALPKTQASLVETPSNGACPFWKAEKKGIALRHELLPNSAYDPTWRDLSFELTAGINTIIGECELLAQLIRHNRQAMKRLCKISQTAHRMGNRIRELQPTGESRPQVSES